MMGRRCSRYALLYIPLPPITKWRRFLCDKQLFKNLAWQDRNKNETTRMEYEMTKNRCLKDIEKNDRIVVLSLIIESSMESSFQFFLQTCYPIPTLTLAFTGTSGSFCRRPLQPKDIVNPFLIRVLRYGIFCHQVVLSSPSHNERPKPKKSPIPAQGTLGGSIIIGLPIHHPPHNFSQPPIVQQTSTAHCEGSCELLR